LGKFNLQGGFVMLPEFLALWLALSFYTSAFIAEIVRAGILAVSHGQWEASMAVGMRRSRILNLIIIPQALRVIVPPLTSQYLNLTKNSSLAIAIGYMDIVATTGGISLMQTGKEMETMIIVLLVYLVISLIISAFMNWYNQRMKLVER
jgi:general L-amino acid transport system permease protein